MSVSREPLGSTAAILRSKPQLTQNNIPSPIIAPQRTQYIFSLTEQLTKKLFNSSQCK